MARSTLTPLDRQVARVRRRLVLQLLLDWLTWTCSAALLLTIAWLLVQPYLLAEPPGWLRWAVLGGTLGSGAIMALVLAIVQAPSRVAAALSLDETFQLRERVTTALTLDAELSASPAGQALLADVQKRIAPLRVRERFPVRLRRSALFLPAAALVFLLLLFFYRPLVQPVQADIPEALAADPAAKQEVEKQLRQLLKKPERKKTQVARSKDLEKMEAELDRLARQPHETREQARQVVKEMSQTEDLMRQREKELAQRADALKAQMKQMARIEKKNKPQEGPAKKLDEAMKKGDLDKAREEMERLGKQLQAEQEAEQLRKKMKEPQLSEEEKKQMKEQLDKLQKNELNQKQKEDLQKQVQDVKDRVDRLTRSKEAEDRLRELERQGAMSKEELERELDQLKKNSEQMDAQTRKQVEELAQKLKECQQCMKEGKDAEAGQKLEEAAQMMQKLDPNGEGKELGDKLQQLQQARQAVCRMLDGKPVPGSGVRPESKDGKTGSKEEWAHSQMDKGRMQVIDTAPGDGFKGPRKPAEINEEVKQGAQEAPEAIDRQRLPRSASDMARGYFEKLRGDGAPKK